MRGIRDVIMNRPSLRRSSRTQYKAKLSKIKNQNKDDICQAPEDKTQTTSRQKRTVTNKDNVTSDVIYIDNGEEQSDDSFRSRGTQNNERDYFQCSQENSAEVFWDCTSPDMRKFIRSKRKKGEKSNVGDIVQTLSETKCDGDLEEASKPGLLGLWMDTDVDSLSKPTLDLVFSPTSSFPPPRANKEKRGAAVTLSSELKEKLAMRMKEEKSPVSILQNTKGSEKRKRASESMDTAETGESPSKISKTLLSREQRDKNDNMENSSETSWSEDEFYEDDSFIIKATQTPKVLNRNVTENRALNTKLCIKTRSPAKSDKKAKYLDHKSVAGHSNKSILIKKTDKQSSKAVQRLQPVKRVLNTNEHKKDTSTVSGVSKNSKRRSLGFNCSLSDDILCQLVESDCNLDSQVQSDKEDESQKSRKPQNSVLVSTAKKDNYPPKPVSDCARKNCMKKVPSADKCVSKMYTFVPKSQTVLQHKTLNASETLSNTKELIRGPQKVGTTQFSREGSAEVADENVDLFQSDEEDLLSEPQVLALLDSVESQVPKADRSFSNSQPNVCSEESSQRETTRRCTPEEIQHKKDAAIAKRLSSSQPNSTRNSQAKSRTTQSVCISPKKESLTESPSLGGSSSPHKCSPEEIERKRNAAIAKRQKKCSGNNSNNVNVAMPVSSFLKRNDAVGHPVDKSETRVCCGVKKVIGNASHSLQSVIEKKRLEALKRRELKLRSSQSCKSST